MHILMLYLGKYNNFASFTDVPKTILEYIPIHVLNDIHVSSSAD